MYGYCRVSDITQNERRQLDALVELNIPASNIYVDKQSGKDFLRPAWQAMVKVLKKGDLLYVGSIDRLGRRYTEILEWWRVLTKEMGVDIVVLDMPLLDTRNGKDLLGTLIADLVISLLGYVAEKERTDIRARQRAGIISAKARGVCFGRPIKKPPENFVEIVKRWEGRKIALGDVLVQTGLKEATFYRRLREWRLVNRKRDKE
jgi:DNA invertase Pin-like site-specific DNA recombinase